jgi:cbb3-type cytochrome oxidase subunit 3
MYGDSLKHFPLDRFAVAGELIFLTVFLLALAWVYRKGSANFYDKLARLPLDKEGAARE